MNKKENMITITFEDDSKLTCEKGITLLELSKKYANKYPYKIMAGKVNNDIRELTYRLEKDCNVEFIDLSKEDGMRIYIRSLTYILAKAVHDLYPERKVIINHSISKGLYFEIKGDTELKEEEVEKIKQRMQEIVDASIPFVKKIIPIDEAIDLLKEKGRDDRIYNIQNRLKPYITIYSCGDYDDYFYGYMAPDTSYVDKFDLKYYAQGVILLYPLREKPNTLPAFIEQKKLFNIFRENRKWGKILGVESVGGLNEVIKSGNIRDLIRVSEALHEKKIAQIADMITNSEHKKKIVLIAGPSSSGKTTFSNRLAIQLRVNGLRPVTLHLDDYFVDRDKTPLDENGEQDFEALEAIDVELFNDQLKKMLDGYEVEVPIYNFALGRREYVGRKIKLRDNDIIIIEGIHGLNEKLTQSIPHENKFKIFISAITSMNIDDHNRVPTTDTRLIRRIVRDHLFRGTSAVETIRRWPSVRRGEEKNIFPFQEEADIMFNSSLKYEHGVMKIYAEPLLASISNSEPEYAEAKRLLEFLSYFLPIAEHDEIPRNSILREFIGGSCF
ncbi:MAG TPA: nucleoside kinase [Clostridiaceae bacterium]|nr:nucleoside kinase [Clostridiaceae bacterium]